MNLNEIKYADFQPKLNAIGEVAESIDDINQCIYIILATQKGSVPHRPDFGSDILAYIDYPVNEAVPNIIREAIEAVNKWETRIKIEETTAKIDGEKADCEQRLEGGGDEPSTRTPFIASNQAIKISVEWTLKDSDISDVAEMSL